MARSISSPPGSSTFRSVAVVIIILILIGIFLGYTDSLSDKAEKIAYQRVLNDIEYSLAMALYDYTIKGKQGELKYFDQENPFVPLAIYRAVPTNYRGAMPSLNIDAANGWYFDNGSRKTVYIWRSGERDYFNLRYVGEAKGSPQRLELQAE